MNNTITLTGLLFLFSLFCSCTPINSTTPIPPISITINNNTLSYESKEGPRDENQLLLSLAENNSSVLYTKFGTPVIITLPEGIPDKFEITDVVCKSDGRVGGPVRDEVTLPKNIITQEQNTLSFPLKASRGASSQVQLDDNGVMKKVYRGFFLNCWYGTKEYTYAFMLQTDVYPDNPNDSSLWY